MIKPLPPVPVIAILLWNAAAFPQQHGTDFSKLGIEDSVVWLTYDSKFDDAFRIVEAQLSDDSSSLKWNFFRAVVLWQKHVYADSVGLSDNGALKGFLSSINNVIRFGKQRLESNGEDTIALFYTGFALGYRAKYDAAQGDEFKAAADGNEGMNYHSELLKLNPNRYDAYFSQALFNFYTSALPWFLKPLLAILGKSGTEEKAYEYLNKASENGGYTKFAAREILGELYARDKEYDSASASYHDLITLLPDSRFYYYARLACLLGDGKEYARSVSECTEAIRSVPSSGALRCSDSLYLGLIHMRLAASQQFLGDYHGAASNYRWVANSNSPSAEAKVARARLSDLNSR